MDRDHKIYLKRLIFKNYKPLIKTMHTLYNLLVLQLPMGTPNPDDNQPLNLSDPFVVIVFIMQSLI